MSHYLQLLLLLSVRSGAQISIHEPIVNSGSFRITDTVYMALDGDDDNPGTYDKPVRSFSRALDRLPFKGPGQHSYGLVRLHPGVYHTLSGFQQREDQWRNSQGATKNVSVEGMGEVTIQGLSKDELADGQLLHLRGSHIFIRNLKLKYGDRNGILVKNDVDRPSDVLLEGVQVDSVKGFGMLIEQADRVEVRYCAARYSARPGEEELSPCDSWPSGIKFWGCTHATIHHSEIAYTRGEGLNFHNTIYGKAYRNLLHDNPLQLYCDNSSRLLVYQNYLFYTTTLL